MTTEMEQPTLHIEWTHYSSVKMLVIHCSTCKRKRRMLACYQEYYGWDTTCLSCGERWGDGERLERPFARGWRQESIARAKAFWQRWKKGEVPA